MVAIKFEFCGKIPYKALNFVPKYGIICYKFLGDIKNAS